MLDFGVSLVLCTCCTPSVFWGIVCCSGLLPKQQLRVCLAGWGPQCAASCKQGNMLGCDVTQCAHPCRFTGQKSEEQSTTTHAAWTASDTLGSKHRLVLHQLAAGCRQGRPCVAGTEPSCAFQQWRKTNGQGAVLQVIRNRVSQIMPADSVLEATRLGPGSRRLASSQCTRAPHLPLHLRAFKQQDAVINHTTPCAQCYSSAPSCAPGVTAAPCC